jgi:hypothetical protein
MSDDLVAMMKQMMAKQDAMASELAELRKEVNKPKKEKTTSEDDATTIAPKRAKSNWAKTHGVHLTSAMKDGKLVVRQTLTDEDDKPNVARATWDGYVFTATYDDGTTKEYENVSEFARDHKKRLGNYSEKTIASTNGWDDVKYEHAENKWRALNFLRPEGAKADRSRSASRGRSKTPTPKKKTTGAGATPDAPTSEWVSECEDGKLFDLDDKGFTYDINIKTYEIKHVPTNTIIGEVGTKRGLGAGLVLRKEDGHYELVDYALGVVHELGKDDE